MFLQISFEAIKLNWKSKNYKLKKLQKNIYKNGWKNINFDDNEKYEFHQYKCHIATNNIDINKIVLSNKFKIWNIWLVTKIIKKLDLYTYSF